MRTVLSILLLVWTSQAVALDREACFTPSGQCTGLIVRALEGSKETVLVQAYSFTSAPIAKALTEAHKRGVDVRVILDKSQKSERYSELTFLRNAGIPVWIDYKVAIAHNKVMVIDGEIVVTGSFNFTKAAQDKNAENVLIIRDRELAKEYVDNWQSRLNQSVRYEQ